jgi:hypothetical protein
MLTTSDLFLIILGVTQTNYEKFETASGTSHVPAFFKSSLDIPTAGNLLTS